VADEDDLPELADRVDDLLRVILGRRIRIAQLEVRRADLMTRFA
jgi:hypothetical protein